MPSLDLEKAAAEAAKGAIAGAAIGQTVLIGVGGVVVGSVVLGGAGIGAAVGSAFGPLAPFAIPVAAAIGAVIAFFVTLCGDGPPTPEEAKAAFWAHEDAIRRARELKQVIDNGPNSQALTFLTRSVGFYDELTNLAALSSGLIDPRALIQNHSIRMAYLTALGIRGGVWMSENELVQEVHKRFPADAPPITGAFLASASGISSLQATVRKSVPLGALGGIRYVPSKPRRTKLLLVGGGVAAVALVGLGIYGATRPET